MISYPEALEQVLSLAKPFSSEPIALKDALGRVLSDDIRADRDYPPFNRATMDGYALRYEDVVNQEVNAFEVIDEVFAGQPTTKRLSKGQAYKIMTGAVVPDTADLVVRIEDTKQDGDVVSIQTDISTIIPFHNIAKRGEDTKGGDIVVKRGTLIDHAVLGALATVGASQVNVFKIPKIAIITTGNEVIPVEKQVLSHQIHDSNSHVIKGLLQYLHIEPSYVQLISDDQEALKKTFGEVIHYDVVIFSGGVSMGDADFVPGILKEMGVEEIFHKVAIKPGKPVWFGKKMGGCTVFGLPGNPVSTQVTYKLFVEPYLKLCFEVAKLYPLVFPIAVQRSKRNHFDHFFPCKIVEGKFLEPISTNGSGDITGTLDSDGIAWHPGDKPALFPNEDVLFFPWKV